MDDTTLKPAHEIARANRCGFPMKALPTGRPAMRFGRGDRTPSPYRTRRRNAPGAAGRRRVKHRYRFVSEHGEVSLADLFGDKDTLLIYSYMFGPKRAAPCPMCTSFMSTWENKLPDIEQRVAFVFTARSPIDRLVAAKKARGWNHVRVFSDMDATTRGTM